MRALGLLLRLLCRPDNWRTNSETLSREFDCGREQMRGVLRELSNAGYLTLRKSRDEKGQWTTHWVVFDEPQSASPEAEEPAPEKPLVGGLGPITRTDLTRTDNNPLTPKGERVEGFAEFWKGYPKKVGKDAAERAWNRKVKSVETIKAITEAVKTQSCSDAWMRDAGKFIPNPATWLNAGRWKDETHSKILAVDSKFRGCI